MGGILWDDGLENTMTGVEDMDFMSSLLLRNYENLIRNISYPSSRLASRDFLSLTGQ